MHCWRCSALKRRPPATVGPSSFVPAPAGALINLANSLREIGRAEDALKACNRALELQPQIADAHVILGAAQFDLGLLDDAAQSYARALELDPGSVRAHIALAMVLTASRSGSGRRDALAVSAQSFTHIGRGL